jgi:hypothetical protein
MKEKTLIVFIIFLLLLFVIGVGYRYNKNTTPPTPKKKFSFVQAGEAVGDAATDFTIGMGKGVYKNIKEKVTK